MRSATKYQTNLWIAVAKAFIFASILFSLLLALVMSVSAVNAIVVSDVKGLGDYVPRNHVFTRGDELKVYVEMKDVNHDGFVAVDFAFIIEDPKGNIVATDTKHVGEKNYLANDVYTVYTQTILDWWVYGKYKLYIYAYDRVDEEKTKEAMQKVKGEKASPEELIERGEFGLGDIVTKPITEARKEKTKLVFYVYPEEIKEELALPPMIERPIPTKPKVEKPIFRIISISVDKFRVKPGEDVKISVSVRNEGVRGTGRVELMINDNKEAERAVTLDHMESTTISFLVKKYEPGTYKITIPGSNIVRLFFVEESGGIKGGERVSKETSTSTSSISIRVHDYSLYFTIIAFIIFVMYGKKRKGGR
ncbi:MAG: hypothetical protein ACXQTS_01485 [Candidatus Methanospirareceae archaeon]